MALSGIFIWRCAAANLESGFVCFDRRLDGILPFLALMALLLIGVTFVPALSLWLLGLVLIKGGDANCGWISIMP